MGCGCGSVYMESGCGSVYMESGCGSVYMESGCGSVYMESGWGSVYMESGCGSVYMEEWVGQCLHGGVGVAVFTDNMHVLLCVFSVNKNMYTSRCTCSTYIQVVY